MALTYKKEKEPDLLTGREKPVPIVKMDNIQARLQETTAELLVAYSKKAGLTKESSKLEQVFG